MFLTGKYKDSVSQKGKNDTALISCGIEGAWSSAEPSHHVLTYDVCGRCKRVTGPAQGLIGAFALTRKSHDIFHVPHIPPCEYMRTQEATR